MCDMLYPFKFIPCLKFYPYGGRRLARLLQKDGVPADRDVAESWEIADRGNDQSIVADGPLAGKSLRYLMENFKAELVGREIYHRFGDYFPLLLKFLDCDKRLPAHLHPSDADAAQLGLRDTGKTEAWYIYKADAGADAFAGSLPGLTPQAFRDAITRGDAFDGVMNHVATKPGQTYLIPAGRMHSIGAGNLAIEIQQNSDAGFGWDWQGFVEAGVVDAQDAENHKKWAVQCALYENGAQQHTREITREVDGVKSTFCAACEYFVLEKLLISAPYRFEDHADRFNLFTLTDGSAELRGNDKSTFAKAGESLLIPARMTTEIIPRHGQPLELLRCYVPQLERDVIKPLRAAGFSDSAIAWLGSYGQHNALLPYLELPQNWDQL